MYVCITCKKRKNNAVKYMHTKSCCEISSTQTENVIFSKLDIIQVRCLCERLQTNSSMHSMQNIAACSEAHAKRKKNT